MIFSRLRKLNLRLALLLALLITQYSHAQSGYKINVRGAELTQFITQIAGLTGKTFVVDPRVRGNVTVISSASLDEDAIYQLLLSVLRVNGFTAVPAGEIIKIVPQAQGKQSGLTDASALAQSGEEVLITRVIRVDHIQASSLVPILRPLLPEYGHVATVPNSNLLIINDHKNNLDRLERLIQEMDAVEEEIIRMVPVKEAGIDTLLTLLQRLAPDQLSNDIKGARQVKVIANEHNNSLLLRGKVSSVHIIEELIKELDKPINASSAATTFWLAHADAESISEILTNLMAGQIAGDDSAQQKALSIQADKSLNAVIVRADPIYMASIKSLIESLDIRRTQVLIEAAIVEISLNEGSDIGGSFIVADKNGGTTPLISSNTPSDSGNTSALAGLLTNLLGESLSNTDISPARLLSAAGAVTSPIVGAVRLATRGLSFAAIVQALNRNDNANLLSTPSILTLNNEEAEIIVGQTVPFRTGNYNTVDGRVDPFVVINREDVGLTLRVTPQINNEDVVRLSVYQEISSLSDNQAIGLNAASDLITNKRTIETTVLADNKQTIALGGLIQSDETKVRVKVPFFGNIPLIGLLFRHTRTRVTKRNLIVFLRPTILRNKEDVATVTAKKYSGIREIVLQGSSLKDGKKLPRKPSEPTSIKMYDSLYEGNLSAPE